MTPFRSSRIFGFLCFGLGLGFPVLWAQGVEAGPGEAWLQVQTVVGQSPTAGQCGEAVRPLAFYERISGYALTAAFVFILPAILVNQKKIKTVLTVIGALFLAGWAYLAYGIDYAQIKKTIFNYNIQAEQTLANIAEAQDRYKSEHDKYLEDLGQLRSHLFGAHGINQCVQILELNVSWNHWSAKAKHVSSPDTVEWDSTSGSSLKKG